MRIAVFSTARTCSTFMCQVLANKFNLYNYNESLYGTYANNSEEKINELITNDNYVVKLFSRYFSEYDNYIDSATFDWNIFDHVFITERINLVRQMASVYNIWYPDQDFINFEDEEVIKLYNMKKTFMQKFFDMKKQIIKNHNSVFVLQQEILEENTISYLNELTSMNFQEEDIKTVYGKTNIDYEIQYSNYNQLIPILESWNLIKT